MKAWLGLCTWKHWRGTALAAGALPPSLLVGGARAPGAPPPGSYAYASLLQVKTRIGICNSPNSNVCTKVRERPSFIFTDPILPFSLNGVIYSILCKDCYHTCHANVGQSGHSLSCRVNESQRAVRNGDTNRSAMAEHAWKEEHRGM